MLLIITKPLSGVGHDKFSSRFGVDISYYLSLDIHPVTSRVFFMEIVYNFNDFYPFQKYDFWSDSFSYIRQLYFCSKFLISKYAAMMTWSDHIIEPRAPFLA